MFEIQMILLLIVASDAPLALDMNSELSVIELQPIYDIKFPDLKDYQVIQITLNNHIKGGQIDEFIAHPKRVYPIGIIIKYNFILLAFPSAAIVNQIQYFGQSVTQSGGNLSLTEFNYLIYYRMQNVQLLAWENEYLEITNIYRLNKTLPPFKYSKKIQWTARSKSIDMNINLYTEHNSPFYGNLNSFLSIFGVTSISSGESIISSGSQTFGPKASFEIQITSQSTYSNIVSTLQYMGAGCFITKQHGTYWTQQFADLNQNEAESFKFGEDLKLEKPYNIKTTSQIQKQLQYVGIALMILLVIFTSCCIIRFIYKRIKKQQQLKQFALNKELIQRMYQ